jgi:hypothetical protein
VEAGRGANHVLFPYTAEGASPVPMRLKVETNSLAASVQHGSVQTRAARCPLR